MNATKLHSFALLSFFAVFAFLSCPDTTHAANGQCAWEGGPGAQTYPACANEDCVEQGGKAKCTEPEPRASNPDYASDDSAWQYSYSDCPVWSPWFPAWCNAAGGNWGGGQCSNLGGAFLGSPKNSADAQTSANTSDAFAQIIKSGCNVSPQPSGWGYSGQPNNGCTVAAASEVNGFKTSESQLREYDDPGCSELDVVVTRTRTLACPENFHKRTLPNGDTQCVMPAPDPCSPAVGNPANVANGCKFTQEVDYESADGRLKFVREYRSNMVYQQPGLGPRKPSVNDYWRHNYMKRMVHQSSTGSITAIVRDGENLVHYYDANGDEVHNRDGGGGSAIEQPSGDWLVTYGDGTKELYDTSGQLLSITTRAGEVTTLTYSGAPGLLMTVSDHFGKTITFSYNANNQMASMTTPGGEVFSYEYDDLGRLEKVTNPDLTTREYAYTSPYGENLLTSIIDEKGIVFATFTYNNKYKVRTSQLANGVNKYTFTYYKKNGYLQTKVKDPLGYNRTYTTTVAGGMYRWRSGPSCAGCGQTRTAVYDDDGNQTELWDFVRYKNTYTYDPATNLETSRTEGLSRYAPYTTDATRTINTTWDTALRLPDVITEPDRSIDFDYDTSGNVIQKKITDLQTANSRIWTYTYSAIGQMLTEDGPLAGVTDASTWTYYACATGAECGQIHTVTNSLGHTTTYNAYDGNGRPTQVTDPNGLVTTYAYNSRGSVISMAVGSEVTSYEYDDAQQLTKQIAPDGSFTSFSYDDARRLIEVSDQTGARVAYTLDDAGNRTKEETFDSMGALEHSVSRDFNTQGHVISMTTGVGDEWEYRYDGNGSLIESTDPKNRTTEFVYDSLNRLVEKIDHTLASTVYAYDSADRVVSVTDDRGIVTTYDYNGFGDLLVQTSPDAGVLTQTFDVAGRSSGLVDPRGISATASYDVAGRATSIAYPSITTTLAYDQGVGMNGQLTTESRTSGQTTWTYDLHGRVTQKTQVESGTSLNLTYGYDTYGRPLNLTTPSGQTISYSYANGKVDSISINGTSVVSAIEYRAFGQTKSWLFGNGTSMSRTFDSSDRLTGISGPVAMNLTWDEVDRVTAITHPNDSTLSRVFEYDIKDRLAQVDLPVSYPTPTLTLSTQVANSGQAVVATLNDPPPFSDGWLALARTADNDTTFLDWVAVDETQSPFVWNFSAPEYGDNWEVRLFEGGSFERQATSPQLSVTAAAGSGVPDLKLSASFVAAGDTLSVMALDGPANNSDRLRLGDVGGPVGTYYSGTVFSQGNSSFNGDFTVPDVAGPIDARFVEQSTQVLLAREGSVQISSSSPVPNSSAITVFEYDTTGNRVYGAGAGGERFYQVDPNSNRVTQVSGASNYSISYDFAGNVIGRGADSFVYDDMGRRASASTTVGSSSYSYDFYGERLSKTVNGSKTHFVYDDSGNLIGEYDATGGLIKEYVWFAGAPIAVITPSGGGVTVSYVHSDHLDTPRAVTDSAGNVVWSWQPDGFGFSLPNEDVDGDGIAFELNLRFPGQYYDFETGDFYNYYRSYDPRLGKYVESDPIGQAAGVNTYAYVDSNPVTSSDRVGLQSGGIGQIRLPGLPPIPAVVFPNRKEQVDMLQAMGVGVERNRCEETWMCQARCVAKQLGPYIAQNALQQKLLAQASLIAKEEAMKKARTFVKRAGVPGAVYSAVSGMKCVILGCRKL